VDRSAAVYAARATLAGRWSAPRGAGPARCPGGRRREAREHAGGEALSRARC